MAKKEKVKKEEVKKESTDNQVNTELEALTKKYNELSAINNKLQEDNNNLIEKVKLAQAETINYRKRKDEEVSSLLKYANEDLIKELIDLTDNFERAIKVDENTVSEELKKFLDGFKIMYASLTSILKKYGVEEISRVGQLFDPNQEEALLTDSVEGKANEEVLEVLLNTRDKKKILESVKVISRARVTIDNTEEAKLYKYDKVAFDTPLLAAEICTAYANGNIVDDAIRIIEMPKLFLFAENRAQITQLPLQVLDSPISKTDDNLLLTDYLITRIARMKNSKYITRTILLDTIHQKCNVKTSKQKQRLPEKIERILKHYKNIGWIKDFKLTNREIEIFTF